jgi:preprotein translocase subunit SecB
MSKKIITKQGKQNDLVVTKMAFKISEQVELKEVKLITTECNQLPLLEQGEKLFDVDRKVEIETNKETNTILVFSTFNLKGYSEKNKLESEKSFLNIRATFLLIYQAKDIGSFDDKAFEIFGQSNGIYNAWPYWREFVQNITSRMGLPVLTIPVFRIISETQIAVRKKVDNKEAVAK